MAEQTSDETVENGGSEEEFQREVEPSRMSWFVVAFMSMCLFMTAALAYYAWNLFVRAV